MLSAELWGGECVPQMLSVECGVAAERWNNGYKKRAKKWLEKRKRETFFINKKNIFCIVFTA